MARLKEANRLDARLSNSMEGAVHCWAPFISSQARYANEGANANPNLAKATRDERARAGSRTRGSGSVQTSAPGCHSKAATLASLQEPSRTMAPGGGQESRNRLTLHPSRQSAYRAYRPRIRIPPTADRVGGATGGQVRPASEGTQPDRSISQRVVCQRRHWSGAAPTPAPGAPTPDEPSTRARNRPEPLALPLHCPTRCQASAPIRAASVIGNGRGGLQSRPAGSGHSLANIILSAIVSYNWRRQLGSSAASSCECTGIMMIDYALQRHDESAPNAISPPPTPRGRRHSAALAAVLLLAVGAALAAGAQVAGGGRAGGGSAKVHLWRRLLEPALQELGAEPPELELSRERLARRLSEWADQRRAALFYLELMARRSRSTSGGPSTTCKRAALAELEAPEGSPLESHWASLAPGAPGATRAELMAFVGAHELSAGSHPRLVAKLNQEPMFAELARLALENANLISRLLIYPESNVIRQLGSPRFFNYLLESQVHQLAAKNPLLHSAGLAFFDSAGRTTSGPDWLPLPEDSSGGMERLECSFAPLALARAGRGPRTLDLAPRPLEKTDNAYFGQVSRPQPFAAKWLLTSAGELEPLIGRLPLDNELTGGGGLALADGSWFSPYLDCGLAERWLLTYSAPFFASHSSRQSKTAAAAIKLRGVSFVSLDLGRAGLVDQCAGGESGAFLADTHQCARLERSQCVRLTNFREVRSGAYLCQCPAGAAPSPAELRATQDKQDSLVELVAALAASNGSHALDQLSLDLDERLTERNQLLELLQTAANGSEAGRRSGSHFEPGAQLEADATLSWLSSDSLEPAELGPVWPRMLCRACQQARANASSDPSREFEGAHTCDQLPGAPRRGAGSRFFGSAWVRPLIVALQSICALVALALVGIMLRIRKSRIILVSGWLMLEATLLGALILYSSVFLHHFRATSLTCLIEPWLRELGFSILYGSILIKLYRILTEFQTRKAHRVCFRDKDQIAYLLAIVLIVVGYMSAWTALMVDGFLFSSSRASAASEGSPAAAPTTASSVSGPPGESFSSEAERLLLSQWTQLSGLANKLNSFSELFSGLLEESTRGGPDHQQDGEFAGLSSALDPGSTGGASQMRCRKLTWDYVTELSEIGLLLFGLYLVYKLRNASSEVYKEKVVLSSSLLLELLVSGLTYSIRHAFWSRLSSDQLLILYFMRCQLTVTPTLLLIFGPKIWTISKSRPGFLAAVTGVANNRTPSSGGSMRHRCHISCELHEHHLNDAMRLHQAMLSNSALDIGTINLADMDPDEIQTELKRVYAQLEVLKTKVMRRDNPHISKRRGGRKTGHRKFSLQAFHVRHIGGAGSHAHTSQSHHSEASSYVQPEPTGSTSSTAGQRLAVLVEGERQESPKESAAALGRTSTAERRVRLRGEAAHKADQEQHHRHRQRDDEHQHHVRSRHHHRSHRMQQQQGLRGSTADKTHTVNHTQSGHSVQADPVSTSSAYVCFDDDAFILNDSQSSENVSPQRQSSFICSHSSFQREDSSLN